MAGGISITRRALSLTAPAASAVPCLSGQHLAAQKETLVVEITNLQDSAPPFPPSCFHSALRAQESATRPVLFTKGLDVVSEAIRSALKGGQRCVLLGEGVLKAPWYTNLPGEGKAWSNNAFSFSTRAELSPQKAETQSCSEKRDSLSKENGIGSDKMTIGILDESQKGMGVAGPPVQAVRFVFDRIEELGRKHGYELSRTMDSRLKEPVYKPLVEELLKSWDAYPNVFESVFWDVLMKLQAGRHTSFRVNNFVALFLVDGELAVGNKLGVKLLAKMREKMLVEARTNPDPVQVENLASLAREIALNLYFGKQKEALGPFLKETGFVGDISEDFQEVVEFLFLQTAFPPISFTALLLNKMAAGSAGFARRALFLAAPAALAVTCFAGRQHLVHQEEFVTDKTCFEQNASLFPPSFHAAQTAHELANGGLFIKGLDAAADVIRGVLSDGQSCLLLGADVLKVQELCKRGYDASGSVDARARDLVYTPLAKELLKSWDAYPDTFESVFWDALMKLQAGQSTEYRLNDFVANFLVDGELAVGDKMGAKLLGYVVAKMLVEARTNPNPVQVGNLDSLALKINLSLWQAKRKDLLGPFLKNGYWQSA
ncbi:hypothetical protein KFL_008850020 [Klebsormidium nitens]|uniref:Uncharacterized protein n=1 Tax=Klebsormidium nitens TaxID=105231 RepID=A0A1Y1IPA5_KLENI|nr:hypothetical protein KFL_008850020 [Klebsormidium nitens]|eukprot:GAQ91932.1 hypothetical protein KFL_008850020 [Klebsormidium nitens]